MFGTIRLVTAFTGQAAISKLRNTTPVSETDQGSLQTLHCVQPDDWLNG